MAINFALIQRLLILFINSYRCIIQPEMTQLSVLASVLISVGLAGLAAIMSVPLFMGTELRPYVSFNKTTLDDILLCNDIRSGHSR